MDDLDREIAEAARLARRRVWRGRVATIASTATFLVVWSVGLVVIFERYPEPHVSDYETRRQQQKTQHEQPNASSLAGDYYAWARDDTRLYLKHIPILVLAFAAAIFVSKRLKPSDDTLSAAPLERRSQRRRRTKR